ncbi:hybrid sensor histidine kinase/response regulator [Scytonema tolypothrichoides VB-61278]|nr:hybrid sensor histidine kinase/response regulator [Scytonema tolypothrichoides VB-61278]
MQPQQKVNILLVDDHPDNLLALEAILDSLGQNLVKATSGEEALRCLLSQDFAVILLDVHMPGMDGFETAQLIRSRQKNQHTPILFLTAFSKSEQLVFKGYSVGAVDYLLKPIVPEILISKVAVFIDIFQKNAEIQRQAKQLAETNKILKNKITEHQQTEDFLQKTQGEFEAIFKAIPDAVIFVNNHGYITRSNPAFTTLFGYKTEEVIGKAHHILYEDYEAQCPIRLKLFAREELHSYIVNYRRKNGEEFIGETIDTVVQDREGNILGLLEIIRDITERHAIEQIKNEFISVVSHELRTPLTSIHGALNLLSTHLIEPQSQKGQRLIEIAADSAERLVRLVNDILDLERLQSGKINLSKQVYNTAELMTKAVDMMQVMANRAEVNVCVYPQSIELEVDCDRIIQVITNLLSNAIKFSFKGSQVCLNVELQQKDEFLTGSGATVLFCVKDTGRGIPPEKIESIFERFHQVDASDSRQKGGTGLGLAICRSIVQQHGGRIWVESTLGSGSSFYFTLPACYMEHKIHDNEAYLGD